MFRFVFHLHNNNPQLISVNWTSKQIKLYEIYMELITQLFFYVNNSIKMNTLWEKYIHTKFQMIIALDSTKHFRPSLTYNISTDYLFTLFRATKALWCASSTWLLLKTKDARLFQSVWWILRRAGARLAFCAKPGERPTEATGPNRPWWWQTLGGGR